MAREPPCFGTAPVFALSFRALPNRGFEPASRVAALALRRLMRHRHKSSHVSRVCDSRPARSSDSRACTFAPQLAALACSVFLHMRSSESTCPNYDFLMTATILTVAQQKGGAGKTTLAAHLAVAYTAAKKSVAVIDIDPQQSLTHWYRQREARFGESGAGDSGQSNSGLALARRGREAGARARHRADR